MTLPTMAFSPAIGLRDNITYPNPATGAAAREQVQGRNDELRDFINDDLASAIDKRTITAKTTTYTVLATDLNTDIACTGTFTVTLPLISTTGFGVGFRCRVSNVSTGVITVASTSTDTISGVASVTVTAGKSIEITADATGKWTVHGFDFTDLISTNDGKLTAFKSEAVSQLITATRDISLTTVQTITGLSGMPKRIEIRTGINNASSLVESIGSWEANGPAQSNVSIYNNGGAIVSGFSNTAVITAADSAANYATGTIQNVTATQFEIAWVKTGSPTGTLTIQAIAHYH